MRRLREFDGVSVQACQEPFSERLGQLFDLTGTVIISEMLAGLPAVVSTSTKGTVEAITEEFLEERKALVQYIARCFSPGVTHGMNKLPTPAEFYSHCAISDVYTSAQSEFSNNHSTAFALYRDFYVSLQGKLAGKIHHLHVHIGEGISGIGPEFAQIVTLDKALMRVLIGQHRQLFDVVPRLLGNYFEKMFDEHLSGLPGKPVVRDMERWMGARGWLSAFCREMQEMLLSELEIRLQPTLGLIETLSNATLGAQLPIELHK